MTDRIRARSAWLSGHLSHSRGRLILISGPAMMVLDEPTNHIDDPRIIAVADRVYDWQDGVAVLRAEFEGMPGS